jgi:Mn2+/Fe2+ NRAMP family transporter
VSGVSLVLASFAVLALSVSLSLLYGSSPGMVRAYERILKYMVWAIVLAFGLVVLRTGVDWGALARGFLTFQVPAERNGVAGATVILSGLSAAVGVNMLFLYPHSLLARGWGREHRRMARFDLLWGMLIPYSLATTFMVVATANTIHADGSFSGTGLAPVEAARTLGDVVGPTLGRVVFNLGILGMALSSITLQMLVAGFVASELFGWSVGSARYRLATLLPTPGVLAPLFWGDIAVWVAVPTNILCGFLLPVAYVGFCLLQRNRKYLGEDTPRGPLGAAWLGGMVLTTLILIVFLGWYAITKGPGYVEGLGL